MILLRHLLVHPLSVFVITIDFGVCVTVVNLAQLLQPQQQTTNLGIFFLIGVTFERKTNKT